mmetsp:Transcript_15248/g.38279  ORF Transcript_15248/g.38279 Transcript_15248/m.38279 type:complete len:691 (+) Transcript_15248:209-2281(+)
MGASSKLGRGASAGGLGRAAGLLLPVGLEGGKGLLDLAVEGSVVVDESNKLRVVEALEEHTRDLAGEGALLRLDEGVEALAEDLLGLGGRGVDDHLHELLLGHARRRDVASRLLLRGGASLLGGHLLGHVAGLARHLHARSLLLALLALSTTSVGSHASALLLALLASALSALLALLVPLGARLAALPLALLAPHALLVPLAAAVGLPAELLPAGAAHLLGEHENLAGAGAPGEAHGHLGPGDHATLHLEAGEHLGLADGLRLLHLAADLDGLVEGDVDGLGAQHLAVHGRDGARRLLGGREAHKAKALGNVGALLVAHHLGRGDGPELLERGAELVVIDGVVEVLDVEVDELVVLEALHPDALVLLLQLLLALALLLGTARVNRLLPTPVLGAVDGLGGLLGRLRLLEVDKPKPPAGAILLAHHLGARHIPMLGKRGLELLVRHILGDVLDVDVGEAALAARVLAVPAGKKRPHKQALVLQDHPVHLRRRLVRLLGSLELHEPKALRLALVVHGDLAREDVAKLRKGVVEGARVDRLVEVLDEDVALPALADRGVAVLPHDAAGLALDVRVVESVQRALGVDNVVEVDVCIPQGATRHGITAHADRRHGANDAENLEKLGLGDVGVEVTNVEGGGSQGGGARSSRGSGGSSGSRGGHCSLLLSFFLFGSVKVLGHRWVVCGVFCFFGLG